MSALKGLRCRSNGHYATYLREDSASNTTYTLSRI
ncbi:unnamed protein product, partial [Rotaria magnacalcarata]